MARYQEKWEGNSETIKQLGVKYRFCTVFIENGKWKKLMSEPSLAIQVLALRVTVGVSYLLNK